VIAEPQRGFGAACYAGLCAATADIVCFMDCDASLDPGDLPAIVAPVLANRADLVLGRRIADRGAWPLHARLANRYLATIISRRTGTKLSDLGPMRAAPRTDLIALALTDRRSGWPLEMVLTAHAAGWRLDEQPVRYLRRRGRSKVTGTIRGTAQAVADMRRQLDQSRKLGAPHAEGKQA
jgi:glycosyltransferase involved in cell wall biosynthesis